MGLNEINHVDQRDNEADLNLEVGELVQDDEGPDHDELSDHEYDVVHGTEITFQAQIFNIDRILVKDS